MLSNGNSMPDISIIIPMYNTEKYIRQCLISVLSQKLQSVEIIVIDDGSTDSSIAEVEKLIPNFDGNLKLIKRNENSGRPGTVRNEALNIAHGKYIFFLDSDDILMPNSVQSLIDIADETQADVVHMEKYYYFNDDGTGKFDAKQIQGGSNETAKYFVEAPTFVEEDMSQRMNQHCQGRFYWSPCIKMFRREFLIENQIKFPRMAYYEDLVFCFKCLCLAKNYVRVPNVANIIRIRQNSASQQTGEPQQILERWLDVIIEGTKTIDEFMNNQTFFIDNSEYSFMELQFFMNQCFKTIQGLLSSSKPYEIEVAIRKALIKCSSDNSALLAYLMTTAINNNYDNNKFNKDHKSNKHGNKHKK